jgi:hypothetical protein
VSGRPPGERAYVSKPIAVRAHPEHNERMGLYGRDGYRVTFDGKWTVWMDEEAFALAFRLAPDDQQ